MFHLCTSNLTTLCSMSLWYPETHLWLVRSSLVTVVPCSRCAYVPELILLLGSQPTDDRSHKPGSRLSAKPGNCVASVLPATKHHRQLAGTKLYCLVTEAQVCKQLPQISLPWWKLFLVHDGLPFQIWLLYVRQYKHARKTDYKCPGSSSPWV